MDERLALARDNALPQQALLDVSRTYIKMAEKITGQHVYVPDNPKAEIIDILRDHYHLID